MILCLRGTLLASQLDAAKSRENHIADIARHEVRSPNKNDHYVWLVCETRAKILLNHPETPGDTPLYKLYRYVPPNRVGFWGLFGPKTGIDFAHVGL